jgi:peptidoglycan/LPS O-acetylase OafA/YrhL
MAPARKAQPRSGRVPAGGDRPKLGFRPDIEGLRAVAVGAVLLCHASLPFAEGGYVGVDVFFVISGFLITRMLVTEIERDGRIDLVRFYAYRVKRLIPLAALVLVLTALGSAILFSPALNELVAGDILAAAAYVVNWHFAGQAVDYFAATEVSPVQHFWSLAIEEQFYLVWPVLLLGASWWWRRSGRAVRPALIVTAVLMAGLSLAYSAIYTADVPNAAFFSTLTRAWELAIGGLLALLAIPRLPGRWLGPLLGVAGIGAIAYATVAYDASTPFPGTAALVPALGTVALLLAGTAAAKGPVTRLLETRPFRYVGRISYAWYLWHWPVLIFGLAIWGPLPVAGTTALIAASWIPTVISHHLVEQRFRLSPSLRAHPWRTVALGPACAVAAALSAVALIAITPGFREATSVVGAAELKPPKLQRSADAISPKPTSKDARGDRGAIWDEGCLAEPDATSSGECVFGEPAGRQTVVLFGDSHAMAFFGAVEELAKKHRWRLVALTKAGCPPFETDVYNPKVGRQYDECVAWHQHALERIERERPDMILTAGSIQHKAMAEGELIAGPDNQAALEHGYVSMLERLRATGARLIALKDLPKSPRDMTDCVSENLDDLRRCAFRPGAEYKDSFDARAVDEVEGAELVDLTPAICADDLCFGVIGDALVYRDNDHMTATFSRTLAPWLDRELDRTRD